MSEMETSGEETAQEAPARKRRTRAKKRREKIRKSVQQIREKLETLSEKVEIEKSLKQIKGKLETLAKEAESSTREHPLEAIGTVFLAGLVVGIVIGSRAGKDE